MEVRKAKPAPGLRLEYPTAGSSGSAEPVISATHSAFIVGLVIGEGLVSVRVQKELASSCVLLRPLAFSRINHRLEPSSDTASTFPLCLSEVS
ncbi:hypothetical protein ARTHRO9AX_220329 [Arthrobacter sp. 9AX]|nr:hypothetical protein ARTHRO9AX_220329 [Arthrobacter sp. 9AX]